MKLTEAQRRLLSDVAKHDGDLMRSFDVYGPKPDGYWWHWRHCGQANDPSRRTAEILVETGLVFLSAETRPYSGRRQSSATITPAGRAALEQEGK